MFEWVRRAVKLVLRGRRTAEAGRSFLTPELVGSSASPVTPAASQPSPIEPLLSVAFSIHSNPGVYTLLLGSGVSRSAGIPTGWEVLVDLIKKLAAMIGEPCAPDPVAWFRHRFGEDPDYSRVLGGVASAPAERAGILRNYFEPTATEEESGLKVPTEAHRAIARLAAAGYVRVIVTTNFDRLLEKALEVAGATPTVVSTPEAAAGVLPLQHLRLLLVKIHGDYLDPGTRNTLAELESYDPRMDHLLDRIFDEYGLVICGWSAEWDGALRRALERSPARRFTTYWADRGEPREHAARLIGLRGARVVRIQDADSFFSELAAKVMSLADISRGHPVSVKVAVASLKRYLVRPESQIDLGELVSGETERLVSDLSGRTDLDPASPFTRDELARRVKLYESSADGLRALLTAGAYWGKPDQRHLWIRSLERILNIWGLAGGQDVWLKLRAYPALVLLYSSGIACIAQGDYTTLWRLFMEAKSRTDGQSKPAVEELHAPGILNQSAARSLPGMERRHTPLSDHLYDLLRDPLREYLPDATACERAFDRFEYFLSLAHADVTRRWAPVGRFGWRAGVDPDGYMGRQISDEASRQGGAWAPFQAGFFEGSLERYEAARQLVDRLVTEIQGHWR